MEGPVESSRRACGGSSCLPIGYWTSKAKMKIPARRKQQRTWVFCSSTLWAVWVVSALEPHFDLEVALCICV